MQSEHFEGGNSISSDVPVSQFHAPREHLWKSPGALLPLQLYTRWPWGRSGWVGSHSRAPRGDTGAAQREEPPGDPLPARGFLGDALETLGPEVVLAAAGNQREEGSLTHGALLLGLRLVLRTDP